MQLLSTLSLLIAFAVSALALNITTPGASTRRVDLSKPFTIKWRTVPSDPEHFTITLVNTDGHNINKDVARNVSSSENEYRVESISGIPTGENYQINFRSTERNNEGILAQSTEFNVTKVAVEDDDEDYDSPSSTTTSSSAEATETDENGASSLKGGLISGFAASVVGLAVLL
ncbi:Ser-Thr-rich glycosyl-phosphatidyl-inositol-anchored membrane family-domain-containing protein [Aspergillus filifer]